MDVCKFGRLLGCTDMLVFHEDEVDLFLSLFFSNQKSDNHLFDTFRSAMLYYLSVSGMVGS